jgi:hypothetical protein
VATGVLLPIALTGCGGTERAASDETGESAERRAEVARTEATPRSACDLLTAAEIEGIAGQAIEVRPGSAGPTESNCEYWGSTDQVPFLQLTVYWVGGREQWQIEASAYAQAGEIFRQQEGVELDSIVKPGPVRGLGDAAVFQDLLPSLVLKGDTLLEMMLFYLPDAERNFRPLAEKALSRL